MSSLVDRKIAELQELDTPTLQILWSKAFGRYPPRWTSQDLLIRALAYHLQEQTHGRLRSAAARRLKRIAEDLKEGKQIGAAPPTPLPPGTRLMRGWKGETHVVEVLADGFAWRGAYYSSLSAIARAITGVRWSGPRFFGLRDKRSVQGTEPSLRASDG